MVVQRVIFPHGYRGDARLERLFADRARLPRPLAILHELQSGLPDPREQPRWTTPLGVLGRDVALLAGFATLAGLGAAAAAPTALGVIAAIASGVGSLGVIGRLRRLVVGHTHEAGHRVIGEFYRSLGVAGDTADRINEFVLQFGSVLTLTRDGEDYRRLHFAHHEEANLGTLRDPDGRDLFSWGIWPTLDRWPLWAKLVTTALDPVWHAEMLLGRLIANTTTGGRARRAAARVVIFALVGAAAVLPLPVWLMAIGLPWTVGYHVAALLQVATEHPYGFTEGADDLAAHALRNWERVPMEPFPARPRRGGVAVGAWIGWTLRLVLVHVPSRLAVLDGSMIAHGWHHLAWPVGAPFHDWWETPRRMLIARRLGSQPHEAATPVVAGLLGALVRQSRRFGA